MMVLLRFFFESRLSGVEGWVMRYFSIVTILCVFIHAIAGNAFFEDDFEMTRISFETQVSLFTAFPEPVPNLTCVIYPLYTGRGSDFIHQDVMVLRNSKPIASDNEEFGRELKFGWQPVTVDGCDIEKLDSVFEVAWSRFGFVPATYSLFRQTSKVPQIVDGKCAYLFSEAIEIDLGFELILRSEPRHGYKYATLGCE